MVNLYQVWFSINLLPELTAEDWAVAYLFIENFFQIGNEFDGRVLYRVLTNDWQSLQDALAAKGKTVIVCDMLYQDGSQVDGAVRNEVEYNKYVQPVLIDGVLVTPPDNTSSGWSGFYA